MSAKKVIAGFTVLVLVMFGLFGATLGIVFTGLGEVKQDLSDVEIRLAQVESIVGAKDDISARVAELEGEMTEIKAKYTSLSDSLRSLQSDILSNTTSIESIRAQVTVMQDMVDRLSMSLGEQSSALSSAQGTLDKLYGNVIQDEYAEGDVVKIMRNGILYYTVQITAEFHHGKVSNAGKDLATCTLSNYHWCGKVVIDNMHWNDILSNSFGECISAANPGAPLSSVGNLTFVNDRGLPSTLPDIRHGEVGNVFFKINHSELRFKAFDISFRIFGQFEEGTVALIKNFHDGKEKPIEGVLS